METTQTQPNPTDPTDPKDELPALATDTQTESAEQVEEAILDGPVTDGSPVSGVCEGRMVAYWPSDSDIGNGIRAVGSGGYIPAIITAAWNNKQAVSMPCANLHLFLDTVNISELTNRGVGSRMYSAKPAKGCWTWIPKA